MCVHIGTLGHRNTSHPHAIRITFLTDQESLLDVGFGSLCGSCFSHKFPADASMGSVLNTAQALSALYPLFSQGATGAQNLQIKVSVMTPPN